MICKECGVEMYLDDRDFNFKGKYDNYWACENCLTSCIEEVRFNKPYRLLWHSENSGVKDEVVYCSPVRQAIENRKNNNSKFGR